MKQVGRELGVRYVLEGSVRKAANRVRLTGQLVETESGAHLWAERYDRPLDDIFALQDEITLAVIGAIEPSLRAAEIERVKRKRPENLDAYDLLLRAISADVAMPEGVAQALPFLERALALEPDYARAHGHLAMCHHTLYLRGGLREENRQSAIHHAHAAIANGQDDSTALSLAGFVIGQEEHDRAAASQAFETALALSPSSTFTYIVGSVVLGWGGDAERAIEWAERALRLSPFDSLELVCLQRARARAFLARTLSGGRHRCSQVNPIQSTVQHVLHAACGFISEAGTGTRGGRVQPPVFGSCNPPIGSASTLLAWIARHRLPLRCPRLCALRGYQNSVGLAAILAKSPSLRSSLE